MKNFVIDLIMCLSLPSGTKKLLVPRNLISVTVDLNRFEVEGDASGSPWVV